jgi:hypothetical protein
MPSRQYCSTHTQSGGWMASATPRTLYRRKKEPVPIAQEAGWATRPLWMCPETLASARVRIPNHATRSESRYWLSYPSRPSLFIYWKLSFLYPVHQLLFPPRGEGVGGRGANVQGPKPSATSYTTANFTVQSNEMDVRPYQSMNASFRCTSSTWETMCLLSPI